LALHGDPPQDRPGVARPFANFVDPGHLLPRPARSTAPGGGRPERASHQTAGIALPPLTPRALDSRSSLLPLVEVENQWLGNELHAREHSARLIHCDHVV